MGYAPFGTCLALAMVYVGIKMYPTFYLNYGLHSHQNAPSLCVCMVSLIVPYIPIEIHLALYVLVKTLVLMAYILIKVHMAYCVWLSVGYGLHSF